MSFTTFQSSLNLIQIFANKLNKEDIHFQGKKILMKNYANHLRLNLTDNMIEEVLGGCY
ncbi:hypothetical protein [Alkaliphilus hydrothermalis]|uniref:Uncharacterized protein n=1 Tax=Alkaliphilus hydrothermalis TaxID=1482730 RepID=A0ABS2NPS6_9FIRM|nr:hypothetical protein [Alkaliphilus hydrothermalis]MBM7614822.1 hypothetical protein [Alkaliphilus hydrothermalis]